MAITLPLSREGVVQEVRRLIVFVQEARKMPVQILVVDDDEVSRDVLAVFLQHAGYAVETADSGDAALLHLQTTDSLPQVVLTDLQMPGTTGNELALRLRELSSPATILLGMSATAPDDGSGREFDGFLLKPFTMETFTAATAGKTAKTTKESNGATTTILDEAIHSKLAGSMRTPQLKQLYALCLADTERRVARMQQAASGNDDAVYKREAHAIKGGCGMVGAFELQTLATSMEERGLSDDHVASLKEFVVACERLRDMLIALELIHDRASGVSGEDA
jgi:CheY-like chemotaxis protein